MFTKGNTVIHELCMHTMCTLGKYYNIYIQWSEQECIIVMVDPVPYKGVITGQQYNVLFTNIIGTLTVALSINLQVYVQRAVAIIQRGRACSVLYIKCCITVRPIWIRIFNLIITKPEICINCAVCRYCTHFVMLIF